MPNGKIHRLTGGIAGGTASYLFASEGQSREPGLEVLGGVFAGVLTGCLPDVLDPPDCPQHRALAHSAIPAAATLRYVSLHVPEWQAQVRELAEEHRITAEATVDPLSRFLHNLAHAGLYLFAGAIPAVPAAYAAHLALDACTPACIPALSFGREAEAPMGRN